MNEDNEYVPDYENGCMVCGQSPVVTIRREGDETYKTELCGPCTFGETWKLDPKTWSKP